MKWDIFISHASEDKIPFVNDLARELKKNGIKVWYDEFVLNIGDSLRRSIEKGISGSEYGIVVLSKNFFNKNWPQKELDALIAKDTIEKKSILPILLDIDARDIERYSPLLSDKLALKSNIGVSEIARKIYELVRNKKISVSSGTIDEVLDKMISLNSYECSYFLSQIDARLDQIVCFNNEFDADKTWEELDDDKLDEYFEQLEAKLSQKYCIPDTVYTNIDHTISALFVKKAKALIRKWINGTLDIERCAELYVLLDEDEDLDYNYILFNFPTYALSREDHDKLLNAIYLIGNRKLKDEKRDPETIHQAFLKAFGKLFSP